MKYLFGPILSRRLGVSLGVDIVPYKYCSFDCVYCESGKTTCLSTKRAELVPTDEVLRELDAYLQKNPKLDYVTFSGNGEPALSTCLEKITDFMKRKYPQYKLCMITNSSSYLEPRVDLLVPSLDAVSQDVFQKINRPAKGVLASEIVENLAKFQKDFLGQMWLEIFLAAGVNDTDAELAKLMIAVKKIAPDRVQLNTLDRPGTESWVQPVEYERLLEIASWDWGAPVDVPTRGQKPSEVDFLDADLVEQIKQTVKRRPCTIQELAKILGANLHLVGKEVARLEDEGELEISLVNNQSFVRGK